MCLLSPSGELHVLLRTELIDEDIPEFSQPLFSVARDVVGFHPNKEKDFLKAAQLLGLPNEFATLVYVASLRSDNLSGKTLAVREELVECLRPRKLFEPPPNSLRAPVISV